MTAEKIKSAINIYRMQLQSMGITAINFSHEKLPDESSIKLGHCLGMLPQLETFLDEGRTDKAFRWLGFIQGVLWSENIYTLDELKNHNRP